MGEHDSQQHRYPPTVDTVSKLITKFGTGNETESGQKPIHLRDRLYVLRDLHKIILAVTPQRPAATLQL